MGEYVGPLVIGGIGLWMLILPRSFIQLQLALGSKKNSMPDQIVIRILGGILVVASFYLHMHLTNLPG